ncbi:MAG: hypothetical protein ACR2NP_11840 [Pirellulaceae bacterium]
MVKSSIQVVAWVASIFFAANASVCAQNNAPQAERVQQLIAQLESVDWGPPELGSPRWRSYPNEQWAISIRELVEIGTPAVEPLRFTSMVMQVSRGE